MRDKRVPKPKRNRWAGHTARMEGNSYFLVNPDDTTLPMILPQVLAKTVDSHFSTYKKRNLLTSCDIISFLKTLIDYGRHVYKMGEYRWLEAA